MATEPARTAPRILGLTGPIACGKTTVGNILLELGAVERIDADAVVHELMRPGTAVAQRILERFGPEVLRPDGSVDRRRLGEIVFSDERALRELEAIVHPAVRERIRARVEERAGGNGVMVIDAVRLLQSELLELCDAVWVVRCSAAVSMHRLTEDRGMSRQAAEARLRAQPVFEHPRVTLVLDNGGTRESLRAQVEEAWRSLLSEWNLSDACVVGDDADGLPR